MAVSRVLHFVTVIEYIEYMIESGKSSIVVIHEAIHKLQKLSLPEQASQGIQS